MATSRKSARIGLRATPQQEHLIHRAAEVTHRSISDFILESACAAAENALTDQRLFILDDAEWDEFQEALERPAAVKSGLKRLLETRAPWEE